MNNYIMAIKCKECKKILREQDLYGEAGYRRCSYCDSNKLKKFKILKKNYPKLSKKKEFQEESLKFDFAENISLSIYPYFDDLCFRCEKPKNKCTCSLDLLKNQILEEVITDFNSNQNKEDIENEKNE